MAEATTRKTIEAVWRIESARLFGGLVRMVRDVGLAEDLAQEALVTALERWPETGTPDNPGPWLMAIGPAQGLELVDALIDEPALRDYHLLPSVRGDLLVRLERVDDDRVEFERAAAMARYTRANDHCCWRARRRPGNRRATGGRGMSKHSSMSPPVYERHAHG